MFTSTGGIAVGTDDPTTETTNRVALSQSFFDERGQVWKSQRHQIDDADGSDDDNLQTLSWFDADRRLIKQDGSSLQKIAYDRLGRVTHRFTLATMNDTAYADADDVSGDIVLEERQTTYDPSTQLVEMEAVIARHPDDVGGGQTTGALDTNADTDIRKYTAADLEGRISITAFWYDSQHRLIDDVHVGTYGGSSFDRDGMAILSLEGLFGCAGDSSSDGEPMAMHSMAMESSKATSPSMPAGAEYRLTFEPMWTEETHPLDYPEAGILTGPHFSGLIGATHDAGYAILRPGKAPTPGLERLSEERKHSPLDAEIRQAIARGAAGVLFETGPVKDFSKTATAQFRADGKHPMVSVVAMIAPSPDWFTDAVDVALMKDGTWVEHLSINVYAWGSGGDLGTTYKADDRDTDPKQPTQLSDAPHFMKSGERIPVGRITFEKL